MKKTELLGHKIIEHHQLTYEDQIYDILIEEIYNGRWSVGDRLPGAVSWAKEIGVGTKTLFGALEKLKAEGYLESCGSRGTFLKSTVPCRRVRGKIGVLLASSQADKQLILWYQHIILRAAESHDLIAEVKILPAALSPVDALVPGRLFSDEVQGVISLTAFDVPYLFLSENSTVLPFVFLCPPYESCVPKVAADVEYAYYELTCRIIGAGHRRIAFSYESIETDERQGTMHLRGYRRAMAENGLEEMQDVFEKSKILNNSDSAGIVSHLQWIMNLKSSQRPTALVCGSLGRTTIITKLAPQCGIKIPAHLSVASVGTAPVAGQDEPVMMTGMLPDFERMTDACFRILKERHAGAGVSEMNIFMKLDFVPGSTLGNIPGTDAGADRKRLGRNKHNPMEAG